MQSTNDIRAAFFDFFAGQDHAVLPSSPLVPHNDPTLLFTNAGMVQFKNYFTGMETPPVPRAVTSQKCVRAGGKHNDLENVGYTARHHTFFEMLGNFSFGDYFKERAIEYAWNLITGEFGIAENRLLVTVYHEDEEAAALWRRIAGLPDDRIIRIATSDNFWSMGETGPCGPCSEIFYDHGDHIPGGPPGSPDEDGDRFVEIWNLVFMQFDQRGPGDRVDLPSPSIDTGMGLERITAVMQGVHDNYDTDGLRVLINASAEISGAHADGDHAVSHRVIADHLRASSFLIADGVLPSNEGRGYVLRRIMRRGMRHAHLIGCSDPMMWRLVPALLGEMGQAFPELGRAESLITETLKLEETRFKQTLGRGLGLLTEETAKLSDGAPLPGEVAFKLYDTFGFPLDLTEDVLRGQGRVVETAGFDTAMERQRADARKSWKGSGETASEEIWFDIRDRVGATEFLGYSTLVADAQVVALLVDAAEVDEAEAGAKVAVVTNQTPFYGESGGQIGDTGVMFSAAGSEITITDTRKELGAVHVHLGEITRGRVAPGDVFEMRVDGDRRNDLRAHHSATHLLHEALRQLLGDHVTQKGSMVASDRLRFDISHPQAISPDDLRTLERAVNGCIRANLDVVTRLMTPDEAIEEGAMALFGEKYGDEVRVVSMGQDDDRYSVELCGGTHVGRTGDIGAFKIITESALASGVRRIEGLAGAAADEYFAGQEALLQQSAAALKAAPQDVPGRIVALLDDRKRLERELADTRRKLATGGAGSAGGEDPAKDIAGVKFAGRRVDGVPAKELKPMADDLKKQIGSGIVAIIAVDDGKASIVVGVTEDMTDRFDAVTLVRVGSAALGGKGGGGRPDMAQAGGPDGDAAQSALETIEGAIAEQAG
jgi:alanyl-tRNA synthetase